MGIGLAAWLSLCLSAETPATAGEPVAGIRYYCVMGNWLHNQPASVVNISKQAGFSGICHSSGIQRDPSLLKFWLEESRRTGKPFPSGYSDALVDAARREGLQLLSTMPFADTFPRVFVLRTRNVRGGRAPVRFDWPGGFPAQPVVVAAGRMKGRQQLDPETLTDLTGHVKEGVFAWQPPAGNWAVLFVSLVEAKELAEKYCIQKQDLSLFFEAIASLYRGRFGESLAPVELAALAFDIGARTALLRYRLGFLSNRLVQSGRHGMPLVSSQDGHLPFLYRRKAMVSMDTWMSLQTARDYGWAVRAASGIPGDESPGVICLLPEKNHDWSLTPRRLRFHRDLAALWGASEIAMGCLLPDPRLSFPGKPVLNYALPLWWPFLKQLTDSHPLPLDASPAAQTCIAVVEEGLLASGRLALGPAVASVLSASCRDYYVTTLTRWAKVSSKSDGPPALDHLKQVIVPQNDLLNLAHARCLKTWLDQGKRVIFVGPLPRASVEKGRGDPALTASLQSFKAHPLFYHASNAEAVLAHLNEVAPAPVQVVDDPGHRIRLRCLDRGGRPLYCLLNTDDRPWRGRLFLPGQTAAVCLEKGASFPVAPSQEAVASGLFMDVRFQPFQSLLLEPVSRLTGDQWKVDRAFAVQTPWTGLPVAAEGGLAMQTLSIYRSRGEALKGLQAEAIHRTELNKPMMVHGLTPPPRQRWRGVWITAGNGDDESRSGAFARHRFVRYFHLDWAAVAADLAMEVTEPAVVQINGSEVLSLKEDQRILRQDVAGLLKPGKNVISVQVNPPGRLLMDLAIRTLDGQTRTIVTDPLWRSARRGGNWRPAVLLSAPNRHDSNGPLPALPFKEKYWAVAVLPAGLSNMPGLPHGWEAVCCYGADRKQMAPVFPLTVPVFQLLKVPQGLADSSGPQPVFSFTPVVYPLGTLASVGLDDFAGRVRYETRFTLPAGSVPEGVCTAVLDLGAVGHFAEVFLDGRALGRLFCAPYRVPLPEVSPGEHVLRVDVTTLSAPRERFRQPEFHGGDWRRHSIESNKETLRTGLIGPVRIIFYRKCETSSND